MTQGKQREHAEKCNDMAIDHEPKLVNDVLSAMLKRQTRPRNWGMTEMTQLIKMYELSGGERKNMNNVSNTRREYLID